MNGLSPNLSLGTLGELLVQIRLLQYGVQAAPPLKDTGNDLIAIRGPAFRAIQVKATEGKYYAMPDEDTLYHLLAAVRLLGEGSEVRLDNSEVYLIPKEALGIGPRTFAAIEKWKLSQGLVDTLFPQ